MSKTKAVILAGGYGTRLRPITCTRPKPLSTILGEPVIGRLIKQLSKNGICEIVVSAMYMSEQIEKYVHTFNDMNIKIIVEDKPLGSAGGTKYASNLLDLQSDDELLILSGDGIFDFDLQKALMFHRNKKSDVTILTYRTEIPLEYGVILSNDDGRIYSFSEKPSWSEVRSNTINTGIYIINKNILDYIPDERFFDFSKDLFPHILCTHKKMYEYEGKGYWCDIGDISAYFKCNMDALTGKIKYSSKNNIRSAPLPHYIADSARINSGAEIEQYSIINDNVNISKNTTIEASVILENVFVGENSKIRNSIICENCIIGNNVVINPGCTIGANTIIEDDVIVNESVCIWPNKVLKKGFFVTQDVKFENKQNRILLDEGYYAGSSNESINTEHITRLGKAISNVITKKKKESLPNSSCRIGVLHNGESSCALVAETLICAIKSSGIKSYSFLSGFEAQAKFAAETFMTDAVIYVTSNESEIVLKIYKNSSYISKTDIEREIETEYRNPTAQIISEIYDTVYIDSLQIEYYSALLKAATKSLCVNDITSLKGISCYFPDLKNNNCPNTVIKNVITELGGQINQYNKESNIVISVSDSGLNATLEQKNDETVYFDTFHISAALSLYAKRHISHTQIADEQFNLIPELKTSVDKYDMCNSILQILCILKSEKKDLIRLFKELPPFTVNIKEISTEESGGEKRASVMKELYKDFSDYINLSNDDGINLIFENGNVTVVPRRTGGFKIITEAINTECAKEIAGMIENKIKNI